MPALAGIGGTLQAVAVPVGGSFRTATVVVGSGDIPGTGAAMLVCAAQGGGSTSGNWNVAASAGTTHTSNSGAGFGGFALVPCPPTGATISFMWGGGGGPPFPSGEWLQVTPVGITGNPAADLANTNAGFVPGSGSFTPPGAPLPVDANALTISAAWADSSLALATANGFAVDEIRNTTTTQTGTLYTGIASRSTTAAGSLDPLLFWSGFGVTTFNNNRGVAARSMAEITRRGRRGLGLVKGYTG